MRVASHLECVYVGIINIALIYLHSPFFFCCVHRFVCPYHRYGLSYTTFAMSDLKVATAVTDTNALAVTLTVANTGKVDGTEVVQVCVQYQVGHPCIFRPKIAHTQKKQKNKIRACRVHCLGGVQSIEPSCQLISRTPSLVCNFSRVQLPAHGRCTLSTPQWTT